MQKKIKKNVAVNKMMLNLTANIGKAVEGKEITEQEVDTDEEKRMNEIMYKYKRLIERPFESDNIYVEMDILNLKKTYQKA